PFVVVFAKNILTERRADGSFSFLNLHQYMDLIKNLAGVTLDVFFDDEISSKDNKMETSYINNRQYMVLMVRYPINLTIYGNICNNLTQKLSFLAISLHKKTTNHFK
ncbi:MAG: hypothetical protein CVU86_08750, partial [Firmicutes bacterium HGW-Firmicutes-11]